MKQWTTENLIVAVFFAVILSFAVFGVVGSCRVREAQAQVGQTHEERQTIALEKIANELGRMRRDGIKCR